MILWLFLKNRKEAKGSEWNIENGEGRTRQEWKSPFLQSRGRHGTGGEWPDMESRWDRGTVVLLSRLQALAVGGVPDFGEVGVVPAMAALRLHPEGRVKAASPSGFAGVG